MPLRLRPVDSTFYDLFTESAQHLVDGAGLLAQMLGDGNDQAATAAAMREAEHQADETTHTIVRRVNSTFVTPFDREDIYRLAGGLDDIMDAMEEAVDLVLLYHIKELPAGLAELVEVLRQAADLTADTMPRLRTMKGLDDYWIEINRLENQGDQSYRRIVATLFDGALEALEVMKLKEVVDALEAGIDAFENVANIVEQIAVKES